MAINETGYPPTPGLEAAARRVSKALFPPSPLKPWTVMILPPDWIVPHCTDPYFVHVTATDRSGAFDAAMDAASREFMLGECDAAELQPSDWKILLLCEGHIANLVDAGG